MSLEQYLTITIKHWKLIFSCFVLVGVGAYTGSKLMTRYYQSKALVGIAIRSGSAQLDYASLLASDQLVETEAALATSGPVLREVATHYPGLSVEQLSREVTASSEPNTQLFEIDVLDPSPTRAAALANDIAATLIKQQSQLAQRDNFQSQQQIQQDLQLTQQQIDATTTQIAVLQAGIRNTARINSLKVQLNGLQQHYSQVQVALAQLELTQAQNSSFLRVVQVAQPALIPERPDTPLNTGAGLLTGLLLGTLLAVLFEQLDTRVRTPEALTQLLDWSILATIRQARPKEDLIHLEGRNVNVESYRILRTKIGFSAIDKPLHTLMITSATPRDGKSVVAANLAIFMAKTGKNTLLIDADLCRPIQHEFFGLPADKLGLSNAILACSMLTTANSSAYQRSLTPTTPAVSSSVTELCLDPFIHAVNIPNLCVMPSGPLPPNPPELLDSNAMQCLFTALSSYGAEVVIFDSPPLIGLSDASILASKVDGTLVVVDITRARKGSLKQVKALLGQAGARVLGCVVNKQRRSRNDTISSCYYSADRQNNKGKHRANNVNSPAVLPTSPDAPNEPEAVSRPDLIEKDNGGNHSTHNAGSPAAAVETLDALPISRRLSTPGQ